MIAFLVANGMLILSLVYVLINELSGLIPGLKNNGIIASIIRILKSLGAKYPVAKDDGKANIEVVDLKDGKAVDSPKA